MQTFGNFQRPRQNFDALNGKSDAFDRFEETLGLVLAKDIV